MIPELQSLYRGGEGLLSLSRSARKWPFAQSPLTRKVANATRSEKKFTTMPTQKDARFDGAHLERKKYEIEN
jgi:hypothetical protein